MAKKTVQETIVNTKIEKPNSKVVPAKKTTGVKKAAPISKVTSKDNITNQSKEKGAVDKTKTTGVKKAASKTKTIPPVKKVSKVKVETNNVNASIDNKSKLTSKVSPKNSLSTVPKVKSKLVEKNSTPKVKSTAQKKIEPKKTSKKELKLLAIKSENKSESLPDFIKHILISQPEPTGEKSPYIELSKKFNLKIDYKPFLTVENIPLREFRKAKVNISDYSAVIFNSKHAIDYFFKLCDEMRFKMPQEAKYFCSSETIAFYLQKYIQYRKRKVVYSNGTLEDLQNILIKHKTTEKFILPCSNIGIGQLPKYLKSNDFDYTEVIMYRMVANESLKENEINHQMVTFFNPEGVKSFLSLFPKFLFQKVAIGAFGPATIKELEINGIEIHAKAPIGEIKSMVMAIDKLFKDFPSLKK